MNRELQSNNIKWEKKTADGLKNKIMNDGWLMHVSSLEMISRVSIYNLVKEAKTPTAIRIHNNNSRDFFVEARNK